MEATPVDPASTCWARTILAATLVLGALKVTCWGASVYFDLPRPDSALGLLALRDELMVAALLALVVHFVPLLRPVAALVLHVTVVAYALLTVSFFAWKGYVRLELIRLDQWKHTKESFFDLLLGAHGLALVGILAVYALLVFALPKSSGAIVARRRGVLGLVAVAVTHAGLAWAVVPHTPYYDVTRSPLRLLFEDASARTQAWRLEPGAPVGPPPLDLAGPRAPEYAPLVDAVATRRPLNVVVFFWESARARNLPAYGYGRETTPFLSSILDRATVFERFYAHDPRSVKSLEAFMLGVYPGAEWEALTWHHADIPGPDVASLFRDAGYRTFLGYSSLLTFDNQGEFLDRRGFESVFCTNEGFGDDRRLGPELGRFIDEQAPGTPFFATLWSVRAHHPYELPDGVPLPFGRRTQIDKYDNAIAATDAATRDVMQVLEARGLADRTVIVIVGDHGEVFGEHRHDTIGHGHYLFEESLHVRFIVVHPSGTPAPRRDPRPFQIKDIGPSVLDLAGLPARLDVGRSVFRSYGTYPVYFNNSFDGQKLGLREEHFKYTIDVAIDRRELYDLAADPDERDNLVERDPARAAALERSLGRWYHWNAAHLRDKIAGLTEP